MNCNTLTLVNGSYLVPPHRWERPNRPIIWSVEGFTPKWLILHRTYPVDQVFRVQISPEGNRSENVSINGVPQSGLKMAWGNALDTVFGSNEERDQAQARSALVPPVQPVAPSPPGSTPIDPSITGDQALRNGLTAIQRSDLRTALGWIQLAQAKGSNRATTVIGLMYEEGNPLPKDLARALENFEAAGNRGDTQAMMHASYLYQQGQGIPQNAARAQYWSDKAKALGLQLAQICGNKAILRAMNDVMHQYLNNPQALAGQALSALIGQAMNVEIHQPDLQVMDYTRLTDARTDADFNCDATFAFASDKPPTETTEGADAQTYLASKATNSVLGDLHPVQEFRIVKTGPGSTYLVSLEVIGNPHMQFRMALPRPYSQSVSISQPAR